MPIQIDPKKFHESISSELKVLQDRARGLIGDANWGEDGRYKEAILRNIIRKFLAPNVIVGTGFVIDKLSESLSASNQIDILIVDGSYPVLFSEGDFIVTTPFNVLGMIEVKTSLSPTNNEVFLKATENKRIVNKDIFNGIFSFDSCSERLLNSEQFENNLKLSAGHINHICFGEDFLVKYWDRSAGNPEKEVYGIYKIKKLAFSYFISNLIESIYGNTHAERDWFLYPIEEGKESHRLKTVKL